jgi:hypothetical protein
MHSGWTPEKVEVFRNAFYAFLPCVRINSKEKGGNYCPADNLYVGQRRFLDCVFEGLADDIHDFKVLKSRQLGLSTISRILSVFWLGMHDGLQGTAILDTDSHKEDARREIEAIIDGIPKEMRFLGDSKKKFVRNRYGMILPNQSKLQFMAAGVKQSKAGGSLARGTGLNFLHASEISSWNNPEGLVSLKQTLSEEYPNRLYVWESTARGFNEWHDIWQEAKLDNLNQRTIFLGWWSKDNQRIEYGTAAFEKYGREEPTPEEAERIDLVKSRYDFQIDREQLAWIRRKTDPTRDKDKDEPSDGFLDAEQAWIEEDAFIQTGTSFFPVDILTELSSSKAVREKPKQYRYFCGQDFVSCEIFPARTYREVQLKVWEEPEYDSVYVIAADPSFGHDEANNNAAAQVLKCYADRIEQVAEFANPLTPSHHFAWVCASLIAHYSMGGKNEVMFILELNGPGEAVWNEYKSLERVVRNGYLNKEAKERGLSDVFNNVRQYIYSRADSMYAAGGCFHWKMNSNLKESIMERLRDVMMMNVLQIRSMDTIEEMKAVVRDGSSIGAPGKKRDDRTVSLALGVRAWEQRLRNALITNRRTKENEEIRKRKSPVAAYNMFNQHVMDSFFKVKQRQRVEENRAIRRAAWRFR